MKNKIFLTIIFLLILSSCGKKGDPQYQAQNNEIIIQRV